MRAIILAATLLSLSPVAVMAQSNAYAPARPPTPATPGPYATPGVAPSAPAETYGSPQNTYQSGVSSYGTDNGIANAPTNTQPDPDNCGTPYEPKACPPMPRRPLNYYPENRQ